MERALARWALEALPVDAPVRPLLDEVVAAGGDALEGVLFFGSQLVRTSPGAHSAYDFVLVVSDYGAFYRNLRSAGALAGDPLRAARLNRWLPPNVLAFRRARPGPGGEGEMAKLAVADAADFQRAAGERAPDHFFLGRLAQRVAIAYARDAETERRLLGALARVARHTLRWTAPSLPARFGTDEYCRRMLRVSYLAEIRPESGSRSAEVHRSQQAFFRDVYGTLLAEAEAAGILLRAEPGEDPESAVSAATGAVFRLARPPGPLARARLALYFHRSKARATLRWAKYVLTFEGWLDYIARKIERRTGMAIVLTGAERRWPFLFLWPRAARVLWSLRRSRRPVGEFHDP